MENKKLIVLCSSLLCLILLYIGTYAYYMSVVSGNLTIKTGVFSFDVLNNESSLTTIDLYNTMSNPSVPGSGGIVPGDKGSFELDITGEGSDVNLDYAISFTGNNVPSNMKFYVDGKVLDIQTDKIKGYLNIGTLSNKKHTISWEWPYDSGMYNHLDSVDSGKRMTIDIKVEGKQNNKIFVYGIKRDVNSTSTEWERIEDSINLNAEAVLTSSNLNVQNDFDSIYPWNSIKSYNYDASTKKVTAWYGNTNFKFDGSNGEVLTYIPGFYYKREIVDNVEYLYISEFEKEGYSYSSPFSVGRYTTSYINGSSSSRSNSDADVDKTIVTFRENANALGNGFSQLDYHYFTLQMLYLVEYADYNSQNMLGKGMTTYRLSSDDKAVLTESNVNRVVLSSSSASYYEVGQRINIGISSNHSQVAKKRTITNKETVSGGVAISFDGDPVNVSAGNFVTLFVNKSGETDSLGMKSGTLNNDGKHSMIYRGVENIYGSVYQFIDGINIKNNEAYVNYNKNEYVSDKFDGNYVKLGYTNASTNGYIKTLGFDSNNSLISFPTSINATNNISDNYIQASGNAVAMIGGGFHSSLGSGLWSWDLHFSSTSSGINVGSRLLRIAE